MTGLYWLASYPKSGNTWVRLILDSIANHGAPVDINRIQSTRSAYLRTFFDDIVGIDSTDLHPVEILTWRAAMMRALVREHDIPVLVKCHDMRLQLTGGEWTVPPDVTLGGVYLVRDPRDVALSLARFLGWTVDSTIAAMETPRLVRAWSLTSHMAQTPNLWGSWSENVESWLADTPFAAHVVRYEDLRQRPMDAIAGILAALGRPVDPAIIASALAATDLSELRGQEARNGFAEYRPEMRFFGDGRIGGWRQALSRDQADRIQRVHAAMMRRLGYID